MSLPLIICNNDQSDSVMFDLWNTLKHRTLRITSVGRDASGYKSEGEWAPADYTPGELFLCLKFRSGMIIRFHQSQIASIEVI